MNVLLSDLKGAQLSIVVALWMAHTRGQSSLSNKELAFETGYHDSQTVAEALRRLSQRGLVVCLGHPAHRNEWALTAACRQMFLPAGPAAIESQENPNSLPASEPLALPARGETPENPDSLARARLDSERDSRESGKSQLSPPESESVKLINDSGDSESGAGALFGPAWLARVQQFQASCLEQKYLQALRAGKVYRQLCAPLAKQLAAEGPAYLSHLLGFVAYAHSPDCDQAKPGAVVYPAARARAQCEAQYLPPPNLDFELALAWALRGAREEEPTPVESLEPEASSEAGSGGLPHEPTAAERAWTAALAQLGRELSREIYTTWLLGVTVVSADEATFRLGVCHAYARAWLETRLKPTIKRALGGVVGHAIEVEFVLQPTRGLE